MLEVVGLRKSFGDIEAVKDVSFVVEDGSCYGLLGPNGAGKTTVISIVTGTMDADGGTVRLDGEPVGKDNPEPKRKIGYVPQDIALYSELSAIDNLRFFGSLYGLYGRHLANRIEACLELTGLQDRAKDPVAEYSGGMKRRLNIAAALLHEPHFVILDEPTVGVDPQSRNAIFEALEHLISRGKTVLYTTHYMEEVERLCSRVAIMDHGSVIAEESLAGMKKLLPSQNEVFVELDYPAYEPIGDLPGVLSHSVDGTLLTLEVIDLTRDLPRALLALTDKGMKYVSIRTQESSLEQVFLHLTGRLLRD
ncbi:MAG: ABC transporter ATP-binding protein [Fimbriimonas sp.]|nr:ABC transporter ATP-binding protein [Fimbriimonas sp.]